LVEAIDWGIQRPPKPADERSRMTTDAESRLMTLKEQLEHGEYDVDTKKVADAILRSPLWIMLFAGNPRCPTGTRPLTG
jgi:Anti-sigma-28 factor, FlgM